MRMNEEESEEDETRCTDHYGGNLGAKMPPKAPDKEAAEENGDDEGTNADGGADGRHEGLVSARFRIGEFEVRFPGHFSEIDGETIGDDHDGDPTKIGGLDDELQAIEEGKFRFLIEGLLAWFGPVEPFIL